MNEKMLRAALSLILVGMYIAGLVALFLQKTELGVNLWVISTAGSLGLLYWIHVMKRRAEDREKVEKGMPYGEPDEPGAPEDER